MCSLKDEPSEVLFGKNRDGKMEEKDLNGTLRPHKERKDREATQKLAGSVGDGDIIHQSTLEN